jgi:hypothetical protein
MGKMHGQKFPFRLSEWSYTPGTTQAAILRMEASQIKWQLREAGLCAICTNPFASRKNGCDDDAGAPVRVCAGIV